MRELLILLSHTPSLTHGGLHYTVFVSHFTLDCALAIDIFCYRLAKTLGALMVPLGRLDALIFTGGIGENAAMIREKTLKLLSHFHFELDAKKNALNGPIITTDKSLLAMVIKTNEELVIANDTATLI